MLLDVLKHTKQARMYCVLSTRRKCRPTRMPVQYACKAWAENAANGSQFFNSRPLSQGDDPFPLNKGAPVLGLTGEPYTVHGDFMSMLQHKMQPTAHIISLALVECQSSVPW